MFLGKNGEAEAVFCLSERVWGTVIHFEQQKSAYKDEGRPFQGNGEAN
jgi:hypothetical protein